MYTEPCIFLNLWNIAGDREFWRENKVRFVEVIVGY